ncbi:unnamed protein product [Medioppia subpectinata]|uniref:Guanylate-binding protein N-terminal domain-containing protein n=1 Tax=Medioppia subpectinata TaxID=1979941 RepID=A0A7R9KE04_9ACAR|nr:unnamed protein product [Medioppia subpectinata]CAG2100548.1 unnamed protein product [Medioppia subpectinata]
MYHLGEGNSFLLNKIGRHIINCVKHCVNIGEAEAQDVTCDFKALEDPDDPLFGFEWNKDPNETTTRGIWFSQPFIVRKTGGEEVAIILVDTQGLFNDESTQQDMSTIVGLSLLSASTLVFNCDNIKDDVFSIMHSFLEFGLQAVQSGSASGDVHHSENNDLKPFQDLIFMIRDWKSPDPPYEYGLEGGRNLLNRKLKTNDNQCETAQFCDVFVNPDTITVKTINGRPITGNEFGSYIEAYVTMFNSESIPQASDLVGAMHKAHDTNLINQLKDEYTSNIKSLLADRPFEGRQRLANSSSTLIDGIILKFGYRRKSMTESVIQELTDQLNHTLETSYKHIEKENESRRLTAAINKITELVTEFKNDIDRHIKPSDYMSDHTINIMINSKSENIIKLFDKFSAIDVEMFTEHKAKLLRQLESDGNECQQMRSRIVTENQQKYQTRLNLAELSRRLDHTQTEMMHIFVSDAGARQRAITAFVDRVLQWYNKRVMEEYGDRPYLLPNRLNTIHEALVTRAVTLFKTECDDIVPNSFDELVLNKLKMAYDSVTTENNQNAPTVPAIGIDLGTTNSCVAYYRPGRLGQEGKIVVCHCNNNIRNNYVTPSCVEYRDNREVVVGEEARDNVLANRQNIIYSAKRMIGRKFDDQNVIKFKQYWPFDVIDINGAAGIEVKVDGASRQLLPEEVSAEVLRKMKAVAEDNIGHKVFDAVITVPAYFTDAQREATRGAGIMAGLNVLSIINEPTAAAMAFKLTRFDDTTNRNVMVFDYGGGTLDVVVLKLSMNTVEVLAVGGDTALGGDDLDYNIINYCLSEFYAQTGVALDRNTVEGDRAQRALKDQCEREKWRLSEAKSTIIAVDNIAVGNNLKVTLTRAKFEELNKVDFDRTIKCVTSTLAKVNGGAGMLTDQIDDIILVGGSTHIPKVKDMITEYFNGRQPSHSVDPMLAVAEGAALQVTCYIQAAILNGNQAYLRQYLRVLEVTPHSLGIELYDGSMSRIIPAQSRVDGIPRTNLYRTAIDNQTKASINVYEGENPVATNNSLLGKFIVKDIPPEKAGKQELTVEFCINDDGILKIKAKVLSHGTVTPHEVVEYKGRLSNDELIRRRDRL